MLSTCGVSLIIMNVSVVTLLVFITISLNSSYVEVWKGIKEEGRNATDR